MSHFLDGLNPEQKQAAQCLTSCLVMAAPGSGKTGMLSKKAALLLKQGFKVAAVTFTRESALELKHRILGLTGESVLPRLLVGTFHSVDMLMAFPKNGKTKMGSEILSQVQSPFKTPWRIVSNGSRLSYIQRAITECGHSIDMREATKIIETIKANRSNEIKQEVYFDDDKTDFNEFVNLYIDIMKRAGEIDFQDILLLTNDALKKGTLSPLPVDYLLIDEFQDTDLTQFNWTCFHHQSIVTAVGDDDQSIYGFRNALGYEGMNRFAQTFKAEKIILGTNYRSRSEILYSAGDLIKHNLGRIDKQLYAIRGKGGSALWDKFDTSHDEALACANFAKAARQDNRTCSIISRTNRQLDEVEAVFIAQNIPFKRADGESILDSLEYALFNHAINCVLEKHSNKDIQALLAWSQMKEADLKEVNRVFGSQIKVLNNKDFNNVSISPESKKIFKELSHTVVEWQRLNKNNSQAILNTGILIWLCQFTDKSASKKRLNVVAKMLLPGIAQTLEGRIKLLNLASRNVEAEKVDQPIKDCFLITAHGSKGLEFDCVWIVGADDGKFPDEVSNIEEERRLFYVAMTRAKDELVISTTAIPSKFVNQSGIVRADFSKFQQDLTGIFDTETRSS